MLMLLTTADLLMKRSHVHSFSELQYLLCFHSVDGDLKWVWKEDEKNNEAFFKFKSFVTLMIFRNFIMLTTDWVFVLMVNGNFETCIKY